MQELVFLSWSSFAMVVAKRACRSGWLSSNPAKCYFLLLSFPTFLYLNVEGPHSGPRRSCYSSHGLKIKKIPSCAALVDAGLISIAWVWNSLTWTCWLGKKLIFDALRHFPQMRLKVLLVSLKLHLMQNVCSMLRLLTACHANSSLNFLSKHSGIHVKRS